MSNSLLAALWVSAFCILSACAKDNADDPPVPGQPPEPYVDTVGLAIGQYHGTSLFEYSDQDTAFSNVLDIDLQVLLDSTVTNGLRIDQRRVTIMPDLTLVPTMFTGQLIWGHLVLGDSLYFDWENNSPNYHNHFSFQGRKIN